MTGSGGLTLVVPCYNEADRLPSDAFRAFADAHGDVSFLFVDDGSTDATATVLGRLAADRGARFEVVGVSQNRGKAEAVRRGVRSALEGDPEFFGYWDADLATPLGALPDFVRVMRDRPSVEIVMGARVRLLGRRIRRRRIRHYPGRVFATLASLLLDVPVYDTQCGAKLFRNVPRTRRIFSEPFTVDWIFDVEMLARYLRLLRADGDAPAPGSAIYELALQEWTDVEGSKTRPADVLRAARDLGRIWWRYGRADALSGTSSANAEDS